MPTRINTLACWLLLMGGLSLLSASAAPAETEDPRAASERRWVPSIAFIGGVTIQNQDASVEATCATGGPARFDVTRPFPPPFGAIDMPACSNAPSGGLANLRPPVDESADVLSPLVAGSLQIMTPTLEFVPLRPRIFATGEIITFYSPDRKIAKEGSPTGAAFPEGAGFTQLSQFPGIAIAGLGSETASEVQRLGYGAKLGIAFPFEFLGRRLWIKPSAGWIQYEVDVDGIAIHAFKDDLTPEPGTSDQWGDYQREIQLLGSGSATLQGIGPGAELEMEAGRFGPLGVNIFIEGHAYKVAPRLFGSRLGDDRKVEFTDQSSLPLQVNRLGSRPSIFFADTYDARWSWEADPWLWRTGVGIRLQWLGR